MQAEDYIKMGMIRLEKVNLPKPYHTQSFSKKVLVIGSGVTGMSAALDVAKAGYEVTIVEKEASIGGYAAKLRNQTPVQLPFETLQAPVADALIQEVEGNTNIDVRTNSLVARIAGQPGEFTV